MSRPGKMMSAVKEELRRQLLKARSCLPKDYCAQADSDILKRLLKISAYKKAKVIFTYVSRAEETDTRRFISRALDEGKIVAVPRCREAGVMKAYRIQGLEDLEEGAYHILEPRDFCREIMPEDIDLAVVPCVSCSRGGERLGYGGGYYDRYLALCRALRVALCRERLVCDMIPADIYDCAMDFVITEKNIWPEPKAGM